MTKAERLLAAGLEEARSDLQFIRAHTSDAAMQQMIDASIEMTGRYLIEYIAALVVEGR